MKELFHVGGRSSPNFAGMLDIKEKGNVSGYINTGVEDASPRMSASQAAILRS